LRNVRALHYSNGIRPLPLWASYTLFDLSFVLLGAALSVSIIRAVTNVFYGLGYLFFVFFLYGLVGTLGAYVVSLFAGSQLAAFAIAAGFQAVMFLVYLVGYLVTFTYGISPPPFPFFPPLLERTIPGRSLLIYVNHPSAHQ
jgi:ATP-binding cassette, subfamily A (ABC1), member 3